MTTKPCGPMVLGLVKEDLYAPRWISSNQTTVDQGKEGEARQRVGERSNLVIRT